MVGRAGNVDRYAALVPGEARVGEVHVAIAPAAGAVGLDRGLVGELAEKVRCRAALGDGDRADEALAVVHGRASLAAGIVESRDPLVAERLLRARRVARAFGGEERPSVVVPSDNRIARARGANLRERGVRRCVTRVTRDERTGEARAAVLRAVITEPDRSDRRRCRRAERLIHAAVVVGASEDHVRVPWIDRDGRLVLPPA